MDFADPGREWQAVVAGKSEEIAAHSCKVYDVGSGHQKSKEDQNDSNP